MEPCGTPQDTFSVSKELSKPWTSLDVTGCRKKLLELEFFNYFSNDLPDWDFGSFLRRSGATFTK